MTHYVGANSISSKITKHLFDWIYDRKITATKKKKNHASPTLVFSQSYIIFILVHLPKCLVDF